MRQRMCHQSISNGRLLRSYKKGSWFLSVILALSVSGCVSPSPKATNSKRQAKPGAPVRSEKNRVLHLERQLKRHEAVIEDLRETNLVLRQRLKKEANRETSGDVVTIRPEVFDLAAQSRLTPPIPALPSAIQSREVPVVQAATAAGASAASNSNSNEGSGEHFLYAKVIETYRSRSRADLQKSTHLLLKAYPKSPHGDNAIYLNGLLAIEQKRYKQALKYLDQVLEKYPTGNKTVSAMFAKAVTYRHLNKPAAARSLLQQVQELYPGSPESFRAGLELRILNSSKAGRSQ